MEAPMDRPVSALSMLNRTSGHGSNVYNTGAVQDGDDLFHKGACGRRADARLCVKTVSLSMPAGDGLGLEVHSLFVFRRERREVALLPSCALFVCSLLLLEKPNA
ncbi:hypothetical protein GDO78_016158 [Eleutherodactylus coqui]|uniref:Uncharacterized protein n=1 Tax=Eleutherodactylus coqui TaxID=57060 RepID=A0A8J6EL31_ELECQ|nr:hypothetical protein GDO78_016158 [Eleutherodactylus coqui]